MRACNSRKSFQGLTTVVKSDSEVGYFSRRLRRLQSNPFTKFKVVTASECRARRCRPQGPSEARLLTYAALEYEHYMIFNTVIHSGAANIDKNIIER